MGWRFKKPINFGSGFRLNLSKRGIGMSWGFPMFRTGISSDGRRYIWITVPRTGLSWVKYFGKKPQPAGQIQTSGSPAGLPSGGGQFPNPSGAGVPAPPTSPHSLSASQSTPSQPAQPAATPWWRQKNI